VHRREFDAEGFGPSSQCKFRSAVFAFVGDSAVSEYGADVQDRGSVATLKQRDGESGEFYGREEIDFHDSAESFDVCEGERSNCAGSGVVDQYIETMPMFVAPADQFGAVGCEGEVTIDQVKFTGSGLGLLGEEFESLASPGCNQDISAGVDELRSHSESDSAAGSGKKDSQSV
jgi:hypothetical protein